MCHALPVIDREYGSGQKLRPIYLGAANDSTQYCLDFLLITLQSAIRTWIVGGCK